MTDVTVYISTSLNPQLNLAMEESLFRNMQPGSYILLLYRNNPSVIIGRNQNPWLECSLKLMKDDHVPFYRRFSGGGTVYHDPGNINYSYMTPRKKFNRAAATGLLVQALKRLGIQAETSPRNDILAQDKKISGSAYRISGDKAYHHGTLLVDADLSKLESYLTPDKSVSKSRGTKSVPASVINLTTIDPTLTHEKIYNAVVSSFTQKPVQTNQYIDESEARRLKGITELYDMLPERDWLLGKTPAFTVTVHCQFCHPEPVNLPAALNIVKGKIHTINLPENFSMGITEHAVYLENLLKGTYFRIEDIFTTLSNSVHGNTVEQGKFLHSLLTGLSKTIL
ncbi:MAG: lipoate--protein ligase [Spirochaetales bacterium]|nr:lipoate--protein ligase [Spirochaetales bacterium]